MQINIPEFKKFLKKATLNFSIDSVKFTIWSDGISAKMVKAMEKDAITILTIPNTIFPDIKEEYEFNFSEPATQVIPYLNLIDDEVAKVKLNDNKLVLNANNQKSNIHFCSPVIPSVFSADKPKKEDPFIQIPVDENFLTAFSKIKKIGSKFKKIYFGVDNGKFYIETTDKDNKYANNLRFDLIDIDYKDLYIMIDYANVVNLFNILDPEKEYELYFTYLDDKDMGMMHCMDENDEEHYYLMSSLK